MGKILQLPYAEEVSIYYSCLLIELCKCHPTVYPLIVSWLVHHSNVQHVTTVPVIAGYKDVI